MIVCVAHIEGKAGVIMGIMCALSPGYICGFQTFRPRVLLSSIDFSMMGRGHDHFIIRLKNFDKTVALQAIGYSWQIRATIMAQATPPG
jgi:hypothetical protein